MKDKKYTVTVVEPTLSTYTYYITAKTEEEALDKAFWGDADDFVLDSIDADEADMKEVLSETLEEVTEE